MVELKKTLVTGLGVVSSVRQYVRWLTVFHRPILSVIGINIFYCRLRQSWYDALNNAEAHFRQLLTSPGSQWKRLSATTEPTSSAKQKGKARASSSTPEITDVIVHRNSTQAGDDVYRLVLDVPTVDEQVSLEPWGAVLTTPELRQEWDPSVNEAHLLEMFDHDTRISKTNYTLGWPAKCVSITLDHLATHVFFKSSRRNNHFAVILRYDDFH